MRTTRFSMLAILAAVAAVAAFVVATVLVSRGMPLPEMPRTMLLSLPSIAVVLGALGYPMFKYRRALRARTTADAAKKPAVKRPDSFFAVRVLLLAKAAALSGALFFGWLIGLVLVQLSAPVSLFERAGANLFGVGGSALMITVALLVERACRLPEDTDPPADGAAA